MLDIVITHYREPWEICRKQFIMLDMQRRVDWKDIRVTVINDGGHRLPEECLAGLSYPIEQLDIPHGGISAARNAGIEHSTAEWLCFCDFDDMFADVYALRTFTYIPPPRHTFTFIAFAGHGFPSSCLVTPNFHRQRTK